MIINISLGRTNDPTPTYSLELELRGRKYGAKISSETRTTRVYIQDESLEIIAKNILSVMDNGGIGCPTYNIIWQGVNENKSEEIIEELRTLLYYRDAIKKVYRNLSQRSERELFH